MLDIFLVYTFFVYFYIRHYLQNTYFVIIFFLTFTYFFSTIAIPPPREIKYQVDVKQKYISFVLFLYILLWTFLMCWQDLPN